MKVVEAVEHMRKTHAGLAGAHRANAEHHRIMSKCHGAAMGKAVAGDPQHMFHKSAKEAHDTAAEDQDSRAAYHDQMAEDCEESKKVAGDSDLSKGASDLLRRLEIVENTVVPSRVHGVTPNAPGITAVPRAGSRPMPTEKPNVPIEFEKLVVIEE
jgi:hypothetical protein